MKAEKQWQEGTSLKFNFCTDEIETFLDNLETIIALDHKDELEALASEVFIYRVTDGAPV
ncbi:hypothetical protein [Candidatus Vondammii sp. HM_W22]|uniref:hypothetical protein n=1 Tax=Candidatus Vondammii sp. HM_W22 TaxID=2687299 RepID=UPI001F12C464|nr:hypothetical protein [Candidatus Vondammii sp. HM_W22]